MQNSPNSDRRTRRAYTNPVYPHACPDPFVLKHGGEYWCYFTGIQADGRCFGVLHSPNLVDWAPVGSALDPLPGNHPCYWAPEVAYDNGRFYMYYSVGDEVHMHIRVAVATEPGGPFVDSGHRLTSQEFAIDPHVFLDDDGTRYLFYATDFLDYARIGTGTVRDVLTSPYTLAGEPRPVTRASYDWQIYDPHREAKGGVCWHTVEGPFVLKHAGRYYQMFSGGNWQNATYGVSYAVTDDLQRNAEWTQHCDGLSVLPILSSRPADGVIGPGHNSVVRGPDNCELYCIYHRWQPESQERVLAIDRLGWEGDNLVVYGPSNTPQPAPVAPLLSGFDRALASGARWQVSGGEATLDPRGGTGEARFALPDGDLVLELSLQATGSDKAELAVGTAGDGKTLAIAVYPAGGGAAGSPLTWQALKLPPGLDLNVLQLVRVEVHGPDISAWLPGTSTPQWHGVLAGAGREAVLRAQGAPVEFRGLAVARCPSV